MLVREVDKIDDLEVCVKQELAVLEKRWKKLLKWSDERALRLSKILSIWSKFRQEEIAILNWIDEKNEQLKVSDAVNMADEDAVSAQLDVLKVKLTKNEEVLSQFETGVMLFIQTAKSLCSIFNIFLFSSL